MGWFYNPGTSQIFGLAFEWQKPEREGVKPTKGNENRRKRGNGMNEIIYRDEAYRIVRACFEVYKEKGSGFLEAVYQECLGIELSSQGIAFQARFPIGLSYKGRPLIQRYVADIVCFGTVLVSS